MSTLIENGIPHPNFGSGEIIQTKSQLIPDSGQDICNKDHLHSSEDSLDSCEEKTSFQPTTKKRTKLKVRSISDSTDEDIGTSESSFGTKGILKYGNRRLRSLSESCAETYRCNSFSNNGESNPALDDWCEEDEELDEDGEEEGESQKVKKTVRFSNVVHKQLFRSNSSILGQRKKNQRKSLKKKKLHHATTNNSQPLSSSTESEHALPIDGDNMELNNALESVTLCDSGIEVEDSDPDPGTSSQQQGSNPTTKKNKKKNRAKNNRRRAVSESSSNEMIFDLDL